MYRKELVRSIGVSNFNEAHLAELLEDGADIVPMVNQIEVHPFYIPGDTIEFCKEHGIVVQAYSPLAAGPGSNVAKNSGGALNGTRLLLSSPVVQAVAAETGRSPAQVSLRWGLEKGFALVPRSCSRHHIVENSQLDFALSPEQVARLDSLSSSQKFCWDPSSIK